MRIGLDGSLAYWFSPITETDLPDFERALTFSNLLRLRLIAWMMIIATPLIALIDLEAIFNLGWPVAWEMAQVALVIRLALVLGAAGFLIAAGRPRSPAQITDRHRFYQMGCISSALVISALVAGLGQPVRPSIGAYLLAVFTAAAFLHLTLRQTLLAYGPAWVLLVALLWRLQPDSLRLPDLVNGTLMTLLAVMVSRILYVTRARDFLNERLIEQQRAELEKANLQLAESNHVLHRLSFLDPLTGVPNRRCFDEFLDREWGRAGRDRTPVALLMLDIDHFKRFNDSYGHQAGDACLVEVATAIGGSLHRPADFLARYGGDEFAALLPDTDLEGARRVADRVQRAMAALEVARDGKPLGPVTVSLGMASRKPLREEGPDALLSAADEALYQAKAAGRARSVAATEAPAALVPAAMNAIQS
jgi:diguanylate cyclase (GGDEF)-like protein